MLRYCIITGFLIFCVLTSSFVCFADDAVTITTYYPSPYGVYKEMRLYPNDSQNACDASNKGAMYYDDSESQMKVCDGSEWKAMGGQGCADVPGSNQSNCWEDVDGDGNSARTGDCDETCPSCFFGSAGKSAAPDGKDQNCNGVVDEYISVRKECIAGTPTKSSLDSSCASYCAQKTGSSTHTMTINTCNELLDAPPTVYDWNQCGSPGGGSGAVVKCAPFQGTCECTTFYY